MPTDKDTGRDPPPEELAEAKRIVALPKDDQRRQMSAVPADRSMLAHINTYGDLPEFYIDRPFRCRDCGREEIWKAADQKWYFEVVKAHTDAHTVRCHACRRRKKRPGVKTSGQTSATHDWRRVSSAVFNDFHLTWLCELQRTLNHGLLPVEYYALLARQTNGFGPDPGELAGFPRSGSSGAPGHGTSSHVALVHYSIVGGPRFHGSPICIRRKSSDTTVAVIEIIAPDGKATGASFRAMVDKARDLLRRGINLLAVDLFPPGVHDPNGFHGAVNEELEPQPFMLPTDKPLTVVAYEAGEPLSAYVEPIAVGGSLPTMPLFLDAGHYVPLPFAPAYQAAWGRVARRWAAVLESEPAGP